MCDGVGDTVHGCADGAVTVVAATLFIALKCVGMIYCEGVWEGERLTCIGRRLVLRCVGIGRRLLLRNVRKKDEVEGVENHFRIFLVVRV